MKLWYWRTRHCTGDKRVWGPFPWRWLALLHRAWRERRDPIGYWHEYSQPYTPCTLRQWLVFYWPWGHHA